MMHAFSLCVKTSCFVGNPFKQIRIQYNVCYAVPPPAKHYTNIFLFLSPLLTHSARLLVQEDVCSAHFNMNIIILYLAAIYLAVFFPSETNNGQQFLLLNTMRQNNTFISPL